MFKLEFELRYPYIGGLVFLWINICYAFQSTTIVKTVDCTNCLVNGNSFFVDSNINSIYVYKWPCLDRIEKCTIYWLKGHPELKSLSSVSFDNLLKKKYVWVQINYSHLNYLISWSISMHCWLFRSRGLAPTELLHYVICTCTIIFVTLWESCMMRMFMNI